MDNPVDDYATSPFRAHVYHRGLPGWRPEQLLHDGCPECEARAAHPVAAISHLDPARFTTAWARAAAWQTNDPQFDPSTLSQAEQPMLWLLYAVQVNFERLGIASLGQLPPRRL